MIKMSLLVWWRQSNSLTESVGTQIFTWEEMCTSPAPCQMRSQAPDRFKDNKVTA